MTYSVKKLPLRPAGYGDAPSDLEARPERAPDETVEMTVDEILPLIYRLSSDYNPLHIDPEVATIAGFSRPIFHGLGTMGIAVFAILKAYCALDPICPALMTS